MFDGAAGGKFEGGGKADVVEFGSGNPSGGMGGGVFLDEGRERFTFLGAKLFGIG